MPRQLVVEIVGDASRFSKATSDAVQNAGTLTDKLKGVGKGMVVGAGIASFNLLSGAISGAVGKLGEAAQSFRDDEVSAAKLAQALQNNLTSWDGSTAAVEAYAAAQGRLGFADDQVRASLGQLVGVTHDQTEAMSLNTLAQDLARAKGIDLATATDIVTKAHEGNGKALKGLGIDIGGATTEAGLLDAIQTNVKDSAEKWADTSEGRLATANVDTQEAWEKIGGAIDKITTAILPPLSTAFGDMVTFVETNLGPVFADIEDFVTTRLSPAFDDMTATVQETLDTIGDAITKARQLLGMDKPAHDPRRPTGPVKGADPVGLISGVLGGIGDWLSPNRPLLSGDPFAGLPGFDAGGTVPGFLGEPQLIVAHGGERITPAGAGGTLNVTINVTGAQDDEALARRVMQAFQRERQRQGMSFSG